MKTKGIDIDLKSTLNRNVILSPSFVRCKIIDSSLHIKKMGDNCFFEHVYAYGDIELGDNIAISGPGTVLHAEIGKIKIGNYTSIASNVAITEFNHDIQKFTSYAYNYNILGSDFKLDAVTKGDIVIEEDVWIGANVSILSGVKIGRGAVIAAGAVVNKDVEPYSIVGGVPAKKIKMRFNNEIIKRLELSQWWKWDKLRFLESYKDVENL